MISNYIHCHWELLKKNHIQNVCLCSDIKTPLLLQIGKPAVLPLLYSVSLAAGSAPLSSWFLFQSENEIHDTLVMFKEVINHIWEFMTSLISFCPFSLHFLIITPIFSPVSASLVTLFPQGKTLARPGTFGVGCPILNCHSPKFSQPSSHCNL